MATVNPEVFKKFKNAQILPTRQEGDGHEIEVEVREDEEQSVKLQEIVDILVAAGYFRARIKGLSSFDKVVGGMTWCIESCNVDVDVDILFQENSTIGQKIALTEKIVAVLPKLKCPHRIEPHQIQGLDFIHIYPVIQWLVKRSMENRQEMASYVRSYAVNQFSKQFATESKDEIRKTILSNVSAVEEVYRPRRYFKRKTAPPADIASRVQITLLEYDYKGRLSGLSSSSETGSEDSALENQQIEEKRVEQLLRNLTVAKEESSNSEVLDEEEKCSLLSHYAALQNELQDGGTKSREQNQKAALNQQKTTLNERLDKLQATIDSLEQEIKENDSFLQELRLKQQEANKILKDLQKNESDNPEAVKVVEELILIKDSLKVQESQFKDLCKQEMVKVQDLIENTKKTKAKSPTELSKEIEEEEEKLNTVRLQLARKNRTVASLQRRLDDVPNRAELAQYQKRFLELYNQVAAKHKETKQYYTLYNTLEDTRTYMKKELSLLNSICDNYPEAIRSAEGKEDFLTQFKNIVEGVKNSQRKVEERLAGKKKERDQLSQTLQGLVEQQRKYVAAVRQMAVEFKKHELLRNGN